MKPAILLGKPMPYLSFALHSLITFPKLVAAALFLSSYLLAVLYVRSHSSHDPSSYFFDPIHGYDKIYSLERERQAAHFIRSANNLTTPHPPGAQKPTLCLGVATVGRPKEQYIRATIGSLLEGLSERERETLHLTLFIAHTDQHVHPIYGERWVETLPDTLLAYDVNATELARIREWESGKDYKSKGLYDYAYLLQSCYATGAPYVAMIEGDVLAVEGWYPRAIAAAEMVDARVASEQVPSAWLYIRMFYTEAYLGWNSEEWPQYLGWALLVFFAMATLLIVARTQSHHLQRNVSNTTLAIVCLVCYPACLLLYFAAGRNTVQPPRPGPHQMDNYGCCSQGFIFSRTMIPFVIDKIAHHSMDYIDMLMEAVAAGEGLQKWAVYPSLLQHIGGMSSKGDSFADSRAKMIWNFGFEMYQSATLKAGLSNYGAT